MLRLLLLNLLLLPGFCQAQDSVLRSLGLTPPVPKYCTAVKDQSMSSTCWSFSSNSFLESELLKSGKGRFDLSEMYIARFSMIRKIERHLKLKGGNFFTPGGQFHDVAWVIKKYGIVPEEVYTGRMEGQSSHDHAELDTLLSHFVEDCVMRGDTVMNPSQRSYVDSLLDHFLGKVPANFKYQGKVYTPLTFGKSFLGLNMDDYIEITSYTHHPFYQTFILEDKYNWTSDYYYNVPLDVFSAITDSALQKGYTVGWDGDADDEYFQFYNGLAWLPQTSQYDQARRQAAFEDQTTLLNHMMHIVAVTKDKYANKWYYVKNSWGNYSNSLGGFLFMREDYFKVRTVAIIVNKKAIPVSIRQKMGI